MLQQYDDRKKQIFNSKQEEGDFIFFAV